jgi:hypothetical protein
LRTQGGRKCSCQRLLLFAEGCYPGGEGIEEKTVEKKKTKMTRKQERNLAMRKKKTRMGRQNHWREQRE